MRNTKLFGLVIATTLFFVVALTSCNSCGEGGLPNGHYVPVDSVMTLLWVQEIVIKGNNFKVVYPFEGLKVTLKYKYADDTLTLTKNYVSAVRDCEFNNDTLRFAGISFVRNNKKQ